MQKTVCIVGLGYVGLPLACLVANKGYSVIGFDINPRIVELTNQGKSHITDPLLMKQLANLKGKVKATTNPEEAIPNADVVVVCVPTPVDENRKPDLTPLKGACETLSKNLKKNQLIVIESTIYPGTTEEVVRPILEKSGLTAGKDFYLAHCPERIDPGNVKWTLEKIPRVVSALTPEGREQAKQFYESIISAGIMAMDSLKEAEAVKVTENTFRDVNIAFVNELARSFDKMDINVKNVIRGAATKPFGYMPFYPGPGVGGHCIPVDPYYLIEKASERGFHARFLKLAREINDSMPGYVVGLVEEELKEKGKKMEGAVVTLLGLAYKPEVDDLRESPSLKIIEILEKKNASLKIYDPFVPSKSNTGSLDEALSSSDLVLLATPHKSFVQELTPARLKSKGISSLVDAANALDKAEFVSEGISYRGIGI